jgi:hypothetical protein
MNIDTSQHADRQRSVDEKRCQAVIGGSDLGALFQLRAELTALSNRIRSQLDSDSAAAEQEFSELVEDGLDRTTARQQTNLTTDHNWRSRAKALLRIIDSWLSKIRARVVQLSPAGALRAVCIPGAARSGDNAAAAINHFIDKGCKVLSFGAIGPDLVVIAAEPGAPVHKMSK